MAKEGSHEVAFREVQRFRQPWLWLLVLGIAALQWYGFIQQIVIGRPFGTNPAPDWVMWLLWLGFGIGLPALFRYLKLIVEVRADEITIHYVPLTRRQIPLAEIEHHEARTYQAVTEYAGWGIKGWSSKRMAYNVRGNRGVELTLRSGQRVMIGSQRADELEQAIAQAMAK